MELEKQVVKNEDDNPFAFCDNYLNSSSCAYLLNPDTRKIFHDALDIAYKTIERLEKEDFKDIKDFSYRYVEEGLNILNSLTIEAEWETELIEFMKAFVFIAHNLNENTIKHDQIRSKLAYIQRYCDNSLTYAEGLSVLKTMTHRVANMKNWTPPSFRLSEHYYNLLKED